ncbi:MAG: sulfatase-like hydrolase/transferase, partial [Planctomycetota bacterium]
MYKAQVRQPIGWEFSKSLLMFTVAAMLLWCFSAAHTADAEPSEFKGKMAKKYEDSVEWWPEPVRPPEGAPNVIIFLLDDVGFAQIGSFGGLIKTPNIDRLARNGLRYNNFHTTALCSPTRASLMAGRNPHSIGLGSHALTAMGFPGYNAIVPETAKSVANYLQQTGYVNYAL